MKTADITVELIDHMGDDLSVVNAARVSFNKHHTELQIGDPKLITYLADHEHYSPFNHTFITMRIKAPIFVARQLVKHEYMPWNEVSRRYVDDEPEFYMPEVWNERPGVNIKQGSGGEHPRSGYMRLYAEDATRKSLAVYEHMIASDVAPEEARMVLPLNMMTEWYWSGTLKAWAKMYNLRIDGHAQTATREVAVKAGDILADLYPHSWKALADYE